MVESRKGRFEDGSFLEVTLTDSATYDEILHEAADALGLDDCDESDDSSVLSLFRADGTRVLVHSLPSAAGSVEPWTIRGYLRLLHRSAAQVKLGVGYVTKVNVGFLCNHHSHCFIPLIYLCIKILQVRNVHALMKTKP